APYSEPSHQWPHTVLTVAFVFAHRGAPTELARQPGPVAEQRVHGHRVAAPAAFKSSFPQGLAIAGKVFADRSHLDFRMRLCQLRHARIPPHPLRHLPYGGKNLLSAGRSLLSGWLLAFGFGDGWFRGNSLFVMHLFFPFLQTKNAAQLRRL